MNRPLKTFTGSPFYPNRFKGRKQNSIGETVLEPEMTPDLAEVCGIHAGDGYMRKRKWGSTEIDIRGGVDEKEYYNNHVVPLFERVFNIKICSRFSSRRDTYGFVIYNAKVAKLMHSLGFPYGKKTLTVGVPKQILVSRNLDIIYWFVRGAFDTDGCLDFNKKGGSRYTLFKRTREYYPRITINLVSKNLFDGLRLLFDKTGFFYFTSLTQPKNFYWNPQHVLCLSGVSNLEKWIQNIGFKNSTKFSRYLIWKEHGFCPRKTTYKQRKQILNKELDPNSLYKDL